MLCVCLFFFLFLDGAGMKFALTQAKAAIVEVIKHFELTVNERTRKDNYQSADSFMSGLDGGIYLNIKEL